MFSLLINLSILIRQKHNTIRRVKVLRISLGPCPGTRTSPPSVLPGLASLLDFAPRKSIHEHALVMWQHTSLLRTHLCTELTAAPAPLRAEVTLLGLRPQSEEEKRRETRTGGGVCLVGLPLSEAKRIKACLSPGIPTAGVQPGAGCRARQVQLQPCASSEGWAGLGVTEQWQ